jgi:pimeloyl-ACP methyl ester carboxylesterase
MKSLGQAAPEPANPLTAAPVKFIDLGHCELAYRVFGQGPELMLVHGYPLSGLTFRNIVPKLAEHFTCYVPDLPGCGETRWSERTDFRFAAQAQTLQRFIDELGLESYAVMAHDTGGTIARQLAIVDKGRVKSMVLIGTEIPFHRPPWIQFFQKIGDPRKPGAFRFLMCRKQRHEWQQRVAGVN